MSKESAAKNEHWLFRIFFLGSLMKLAGELVGSVADVLGLSSKKK